MSEEFADVPVDVAPESAPVLEESNYTVETPVGGAAYHEPVDDPQPATTIWFNRHRTRHNKFPDQHNKDPAFFTHDKHVFILSYAGRPIFSRYGDETMLAAYTGVISAIISNVESMGDAVRVLIAGPWKFVFLFKGMRSCCAWIDRSSRYACALVAFWCSRSHLFIVRIQDLRVGRPVASPVDGGPFAITYVFNWQYPFGA